MFLTVYIRTDSCTPVAPDKLSLASSPRLLVHHVCVTRYFDILKVLHAPWKLSKNAAELSSNSIRPQGRFQGFRIVVFRLKMLLCAFYERLQSPIQPPCLLCRLSPVPQQTTTYPCYLLQSTQHPFASFAQASCYLYFRCW